MKPYSAPLIDRSSGDRAERVAIKSLDEDAQVLLTSVVIDKKWFDTITSGPAEYKVYAASADLGFKKDNKWRELTSQPSVKASTYIKLLRAISACNSGKSASAEGKEDEEESSSDDERKEIEF
jgi:hypothetical protein